MKKRILKIVLFVLTAYVLLFFAGRYAWRLRGFEGCNDINTCIVTVEEVKKDKISLKSDTDNSIFSYIGNYYKIEGNRLYIGLKYNSLLGFLKRNDIGEIEIYCDTSIIDEIILKDFKEEKVIWTKTTNLLK